MKIFWKEQRDGIPKGGPPACPEHHLYRERPAAAPALSWAKLSPCGDPRSACCPKRPDSGIRPRPVAMETQRRSEEPPLAHAQDEDQARADVGGVSRWTAPPLRPERRPGASGSVSLPPGHADEGSPVTARGHWPVARFSYVCQLIVAQFCYVCQLVSREEMDTLKLSLSHNYGKPMTRTSQLTVLCREAMRRRNSQPVGICKLSMKPSSH